MGGQVTVIEHPIVQDALARLRDKATPPAVFRDDLRRVGWILGYEALRDCRTEAGQVETPVAPAQVRRLCEPLPALVTVLRAGNGLLEGLLDLLPAAPVGHLGLYRDHKTLEAVEYYRRLPKLIEQRLVLICDPMLATGHTSVAALKRLAEAGAKSVRYLCLVAAPEGIAAVHAAFPQVQIWTAAVDEKLNEHSYIVPGLGDAGDRLYGTF